MGRTGMSTADHSSRGPTVVLIGGPMNVDRYGGAILDYSVKSTQEGNPKAYVAHQALTTTPLWWTTVVSLAMPLLESSTAGGFALVIGKQMLFTRAAFRTGRSPVGDSRHCSPAGATRRSPAKSSQEDSTLRLGMNPEVRSALIPPSQGCGGASFRTTSEIHRRGKALGRDCQPGCSEGDCGTSPLTPTCGTTGPRWRSVPWRKGTAIRRRRGAHCPAYTSRRGIPAAARGLGGERSERSGALRGIS